ncbi:hypothetical protein ACGFIK_27590 [Micromonospora sp. NPDC048871]|uniref:hypothetical protein n=1 Tax=unclassified Micromonospora TaxID=2617518 RepID=UPI002E0E0604|nr:hypothetical protein OIE53_25465 [Micromonospora sp. NBC_01739]
MAWEWLAPAGTVVGAMVGALAGVTASALTAKSGRRTQVELAKVQSESALTKALLDEKRVLYAKFLSLADNVRNRISLERKKTAALFQLVGREEPDDDEIQLEGEAADVQLPPEVVELLAEMSGLRMQVMILGGPDMAREASDLYVVVRDYARGEAKEADVVVAMVSVGDAMHLDACRQ